MDLPYGIKLSRGSQNLPHMLNLRAPVEIRNYKNRIFVCFSDKWLIYVLLEGNKIKIHAMKDQKLFHYDMQKVSQDFLLFLNEKMHTNS